MCRFSIVRYKFLFFLFFLPFICLAQSRSLISLNSGWEFSKDANIEAGNSMTGKVSWQSIQLPHSWNSSDVMDDEPGYYRGKGWYRRKLILHPADAGRKLFLRFEGVNQTASVYVNGKLAGTHIGGYTAFQFPVHSFLRFDGTANEIMVMADNSPDPDIPPLSADFSFFGGIYRDAWLINTSSVHFSMDDHGADAFYLSSPLVDSQQASIKIRGLLQNELSRSTKVIIHSVVADAAGREVSGQVTKATLKSHRAFNVEQVLPLITHPVLWSPDHPYLYTVRTSVQDAKTGQLLDEMTQPFGFRWFSFDADKGFFLNGQPLKLVGSSRHQDRPGMGNAVPDALAIADIELLKAMGGNFLRVAHYPQDPSVLQTCDRLGILASVEIPIVNEITESAAFNLHCEQMLVEMIRQNYNHPSLVIWCYMNEVLLRSRYNDDKPRQQVYFNSITQLARRLDSLTRKEDPSRYTMMAQHGDYDKYNNIELTQIPMIVGWNLYNGWYGGSLENFPAFLDKHHRLLPAKPLVVSEYGADADPRIRSFEPLRFDKSVEYTNRFHQYYFKEMMQRPFVAAAMIWNLADFSSETREETMPHINNKGLLTWDRKQKDPYSLYQALLLKSPFIKIASSSWTSRTGTSDSVKKVCYQPLQVASNLDSMELFLNEQSQGWQQPNNGMGEWSIPFVDGENKLLVRGYRDGKEYSDQLTIQFSLIPWLLADTSLPFTSINILLGGNRYFHDDITGETWMPSQPYRSGSWGHVSGKAFHLTGNNRLPYGTDKNILGTDNDPVYQTQQVGLTSFALDVPAGKYEIQLHFAELQGGMSKELLYNLSDSSRKDKAPHRVFSVFANDHKIIDRLNLAAEYGTAKAVVIKTILHVKKNEGIKLLFEPVEGEAILNALQVKKLD